MGERRRMKAKYKVFHLADAYLEKTRKLLDDIGPEKLICIMPLQIKHLQADRIVVWYWEEE